MTYLYVMPFTIPWSILMLGLFFLSAIFISVGKNASSQWKNRLLMFLGFYLFFDILVFEYYFYHYDSYTLKFSLPLSYCTIMQMIAVYAAIKRSKVAFEFSLLLGIIAPFQSFFSPVIVKSEETYLLIDYFISHAATILVPIYMVKVLNFRPRKFAFIYTALLIQVVVISVYFIDIALGANYMYLVKPPVGNLVISGIWPYYVIVMHVAIYISAFLINICFVFCDLLDRKTTGKLL